MLFERLSVDNYRWTEAVVWKLDTKPKVSFEKRLCKLSINHYYDCDHMETDFGHTSPSADSENLTSCCSPCRLRGTLDRHLQVVQKIDFRSLAL